MSQNCNVCSKDVASDCIVCKRCNNAFHPACVNVTPNDVAYLNDSQEVWCCGDCGKRRVLRSNSTSSSSSKSRGNNDPLTVEHFNRLMASIQVISSDIMEIKMVQQKVQSNLSQVNDILASHSATIDKHSELIAKCQSDLHGQTTAVSGCCTAVDGLQASYDRVSKQVEDLQTLIKSQPSTSGDCHPVTTKSQVTSPDTDEKIRKAHNLIIYGLPEGQEDATLVGKLVDAISSNSSRAILSVSRIRQAKKKTDKPRLVRVTFNNIILPKTLLRNKAVLLSTDFKNVLIKDDKTLIELQLLESLRKQLKARQDAGESDLTIKYVRGQPTIISCPPKN